MSNRPIIDESKFTYCYVFVGEAVRTRDDKGWRTSSFPSGVFSSTEMAVAWIAEHQLSGVLTRYAIDVPAFEYSLYLKSVSSKDQDGRFRQVWSGGEVHSHFENGVRTA